MSKEVIDLNKQPRKVIGVDVGTMTLVCAQQVKDQIEFSSMRNMYLPLDKDQLVMAELSKIDFVESEDSVFIIGEDSFNFANIFGKKVKRPMSKGLISPDEIDSLDVLYLILEKLCGKATDGICIYSVPAPSIDVENNIIYHEGVFKRIFNDLGYRAEPFNEAMGIIYSQCQDDQFTGLAFSFGAGMCNVSLAYKSVPVISFSVARAGDWIDEQTAMSLGTVSNRITKIKETSVDLLNYMVGGKKERRIREAIAYYYKEMIRYSLDQIKNKLLESADNLDLPDSLSVIVSGGTSKISGFLDLFKQILNEYEDSIPIQVKDVRAADDPMTAVAEGLLVKAMSKYGKKEE